MTIQKWSKCTENNAAMYMHDLRPISKVKGDSLKEFCNEVNATYRAVINGLLLLMWLLLIWLIGRNNL